MGFRTYQHGWLVMITVHEMANVKRALVGRHDNRLLFNNGVAVTIMQ